jgi:RimJ/RimL family protein N-acetyltransferase
MQMVDVIMPADTSTDALRFTPDYRERLRLRDGTEVLLRLVIPADRLLLQRGMDRFSPVSRYNRFLGAKRDLTADELDYLTELDGVDHFALGALATDAEGQAQGVGVARFVRFGDETDSAEPTVAIVDEYQGRGLGTILFARLMAAARERGIRRFHGRMLAHNKVMRALLHHASPTVRWAGGGYVSEFWLDL